MRVKRLSIILLLYVLSVPATYAWDILGHEVVIAVAQRHLTPKTKENLAKYIAYDLKQDAVWMDDHRHDEPIAFTHNWHTCYFDDNLHYNPYYLRKTGTGDVIRALYLVESALGNGHYKYLPDENVILSIRMLIHYVGDMHCPTHTHHNFSSAKWDCTLNGKEMTFHTVYDLMPDFLWGEMPADEIAANIDDASRRERRKVADGDLIDWANDAAKDNIMVYRWNLPDTKILREDTVKISKNLVNLQMRNAGYRLAYLLNQYFGK